MTKVPLKEIKVGFRTRFDIGNIAELAEDIKIHGMLHPILVIEESIKDQVSSTELKSPISNLPTDAIGAEALAKEALAQAGPQVESTRSAITPTPEYELIAGFRRLKAAESLGWTEIPVTIQVPSIKYQVPNTGIKSEISNPSFDSTNPDGFSEREPETGFAQDKQSAISIQKSAISLLVQFDMQLSENMNRKDLNPLELSDAILERKHRFEQVYGKIERGGDRKSQDYQEIKDALGVFDFPNFYETTAKLLKMNPKSISTFLRLNNLDPDLKEQVSNRTIGYREALTQQADRNRAKKQSDKRKSGLTSSIRLPNLEDIAPLQAQYQSAPNLMQLFMLIQHSFQTVQKLQEKPLEYDKFQMEYLFVFIQQMEVVIEYYREVLVQLNQTQESKLTELK